MDDDETAARGGARGDGRGDGAVGARLSVYIFSVSAGLAGVCVTIIGLFRVVVPSQQVDSIADNLLAIDALLLLAAALLAYLALRAGATRRARRLEQCADVVFLTGLGLLVAVGGLIAYEVI